MGNRKIQGRLNWVDGMKQLTRSMFCFPAFGVNSTHSFHSCSRSERHDGIVILNSVVIIHERWRLYNKNMCLYFMAVQAFRSINSRPEMQVETRVTLFINSLFSCCVLFQSPECTTLNTLKQLPRSKGQPSKCVWVGIFPFFLKNIWQNWTNSEAFFLIVEQFFFLNDFNVTTSTYNNLFGCDTEQPILLSCYLSLKGTKIQIAFLCLLFL